MIAIRRSAERGHFDHGWLDTFHTFSFGDYYDPQFMGFRSLRVINEDRVEPGGGFPTHGHREMEIITYIVDGKLEHKDSMGTVTRITPGEVQHMTAGSGITHSEYNPSRIEPVHLLQIWIQPRELHLTPAYQEQSFSVEERSGVLRLIATPDGQGDALPVEQDVQLYASLLATGQGVEHKVAPGRYAWVQVVRGDIELRADGDGAGAAQLHAGDGAALSGVQALAIAAQSDAELLLFDLA